MAGTDVQGMLVRIEATTAQLRQELARADSSVGQASDRIDRNLSRVDNAFDRAGDRAQHASGLIKSALAAAVGAASIGKIIETADAYSQMSDRIGMATGSVGEYNLVQDRLLETAKRTYRPLAEAQELYIRTSGSLKSMGYNTSQALDVMDSFSFLLVTNSASADKASSAIDAYSKALQTGKVDADGWQAILAAMPTVVDTIATATGKTSEEIRSLGAQGKLSLEPLTEGLQKTVGANGELADSMGVAVRDAMQNLSNSFTVYVGRLNETTDFTGVLGKGIAALGDNFEALADIAVVTAIAALTRYAATAATAAATATYSAYRDVAARKAQATAVLLASQAELQKAQTSVALAQREAIAARGTAVQTEMSLQLAAARMLEAKATNAVAVAQVGVSRASSGLLGVLGGPLGVAALAIVAATAFLTLRDNSGFLEEKLGDLNAPLDLLIKKFNELGRATQSVTLRELRSEIDKTQRKIEESSGAIADKFESSLRGAGAAGQDGGLAAGFVSLSKDAQTALDIVRKASADAKNGVEVDWSDVANKVRAFPSVVSESMAQGIEESAGNVEKLTVALANHKTALTAFSAENTKSADGLGKNAAAAAAAAAAGQKYLDQLDKQLETLQDKTAAEAAERVILKEKIDTESELAATIRARAKAIDEQKKADSEASKAKQKNNSSSDTAAKQQLKSFESTEEGYKRQIELINTTGDKTKDATEVMKLSFELQEGKLGKLTEAQKKKLQGMAAELDTLNALKKANEDALRLEAFKNAQGVGTQTMKDGFDQELAGAGMGDKARDRMKADLALRQKYAADIASLNEQRNTGQIMPDLYLSETAVLQEELAKRLQAQQDFYAATDEQQTNWMNGVNEAWSNYADAARNYSQQAADLTSEALGTATSGLGTFFYDVATGAQSAGDALGDMVGNFAKSMLQALADMAAQWLIYQGVQMLVGKTTQVSAAGTMAANASAMSLQAGLAAFASTAAIPIVGPFAAPGAMAAAMAVTGPLAAAVGMTAMAGAGFEEGGFTGFGPKDEIAGPVHRGEYVFDAEATARIGVGTLEAMSNGRPTIIGAGKGNTSVTQAPSVAAPDLNIQIHNYSDSSVSTKRDESGQLQVIIRAVEEHLVGGMLNGDGDLLNATQTAFNLKKGSR